MNLYRPSSDSGRKGRRGLLIATVLVAILFVADGLSGGNIRTLIRSGAATLWSTVTHTGETITGSGMFATRRALESENAALRKDLTEVQLRAAAFEFLRSENESLRGIVQIVEDSDGITVPIVSSLRSSPYGTFLIGAGTESGLNEGDLVMIGDSAAPFAIGRIETLDERISVVKELFAPDKTIEGVVGGVSVIFDGRGGGQARGEAPRDADVQVGDVVVSAAVRGRAIGVVGKVEEDSGGASKKLYANIPVSMFDIRFVYVVTQ